jgi:biopolymer transport protein ExbD
MDRTDLRTETNGSRRRSGKHPNAEAAVAQPPLTPMIDVVFQLLLFFLLGCHFVAQEGQLRANLPKLGGSGDRVIPPVMATVYLRPSGANDSGVLADAPILSLSSPSMPLLHDKLKHLLTQPGMSELGVRIVPVGAVRWQHVVDAFNQARRAGCTNVGLVDSGATR